MFALAGLGLHATAFAQRVYWEPNHGVLGLGKNTELTLVFEGCLPSGDVVLPPIPGLAMGRPSVEQRITTNFGTSYARVVLSYPVQPTSRNDVVIPAFDAVTDRGKIAVGEVRFSVGDATVGQTELKISDVVTGTVRPSRTTVWAGEVFDLEYVLLVNPRYRPQVAPPEWKPTSLLAEAFGDYEDVREQTGGDIRVGARYRTRVAATTGGTLQLAPVRQTVNLQTGERSGIFSQPRIESFTIESNRPELTVRPLPPAPPGFTGAVGTFELESKVVPETARVGDPITWTMTLRGVGNWPSNPTLPEREVSADFQVVQPQGRQAMDDGRLFSGSLTEDAVLVPTRAGTYEIGPVKFVWFDTASGAYRESVVPAVSVTIQPSAASTLANPPAPELAPPAPNEVAGPRALPGELAAPSQLPRDPLDGRGSGLAPLGLEWWWWLPLAFAPPALLWLALAWQTMLRSDDVVPRRIARQKLVRGFVAMSRAGMKPDRAALESWRALCAQLWAIPRVTPTTEDLVAAVASLGGAPQPDVWPVLWQEAEAAMFAAAQPLPPDWAARALAAARAVRLRRQQSTFPWRPRYWRPASASAVVMFGLVLSVVTSIRSDAAEVEVDAGTRAYREGKLAAARAAWSIDVTANPRDWVLRNNLALACAQQEDWPTATAHWTAAFLLNPREPSIRDNLRLALTHLDGVDPELRRIVDGSIIDRAVTILAPGEWEVLYLGGAATIAAALSLFIATLYLRSGRTSWIRLGFTLGPLGVLASVAGFTGTLLYGALGDPNAGLIAKATEMRSIPTDLAENQQTAPISAGAVVVKRRTFLGWDGVDATHPGSGWLRREVIIPFYAAPPAKKAAGEPL